MLYAGRREEGKGWNLLLEAHAAAVARGADLDLVTMGVGPVLPPPGLEDRVHDLGFLDDAEAPSAFAAAAAYIQPSRHESFSRTVMEAWLAGTLVVANGDSAVVRWHCERSGAGLVWYGLDELTAALELRGGGAAGARRGGLGGTEVRPRSLHLAGGPRPDGSLVGGPVRWVIVGPFAPERGDGPDAAVAATAARLQAGDDVLTVAPRPSAAHRHQPLVGRSAWRRLAQLLEPGDGLWVRLEPGVLFTRTPGRVEALVERVGFRWAVRRCSRVVVDVGDVALLPGGRAGALAFAAIDELVAHSEADRQALLAAGARTRRGRRSPAPGRTR